MKTIIKNHNTIEKPFPKLRSSISNPDKIVLFIDAVEGTVVSTNRNSNLPIGYHSKHWSSKDFVDFQGELTLSND